MANYRIIYRGEHFCDSQDAETVQQAKQYAGAFETAEHTAFDCAKWFNGYSAIMAGTKLYAVKINGLDKWYTVNAADPDGARRENAVDMLRAERDGQQAEPAAEPVQDNAAAVSAEPTETAAPAADPAMVQAEPAADPVQDNAAAVSEEPAAAPDWDAINKRREEHYKVMESWFWLGQDIKRKHYTIIFDGSSEKTILRFKNKPSKQIIQAVKDAKFYYSPIDHEWRRGVNHKSFIAAQKLDELLCALYSGAVVRTA